MLLSTLDLLIAFKGMPLYNRLEFVKKMTLFAYPVCVLLQLSRLTTKLSRFAILVELGLPYKVFLNWPLPALPVL